MDILEWITPRLTFDLFEVHQQCSLKHPSVAHLSGFVHLKRNLRINIHDSAQSLITQSFHGIHVINLINLSMF